MTLSNQTLPSLTVPSYSLRYRIKKGVSWSLFGNVSWRFLSAASMIFVAHILGKEKFGELGMIRTTVDMFAVFASFRLGTTATKYVAEFRIKDPAKAAIILKLITIVSFITCLFVSLICSVASPYLANTVLNRPEMTSLIALASLFLFCNIFGTILEFSLAGFEAFKSIAVVNVLRGLASPVLIVPSAFYWGVKGVITALIFNSFIVLVAYLRFLRYERTKYKMPQKIPFSKLKSQLTVLWNFALPGVLSGILFAVILWAGRVVLANLENGWEQLGVFSAANQWRVSIIFIPGIIGRVLLPILSETHGNNKDRKFGRLVSHNIRVVWLIAFPFTVAAVVFSGPMASVFGSEFKETEKVIPILMLSVFFYVISVTVRHALDGAGRRWTNLAMTFCWAAFFLISTFFAVPKLGAIGLALVHLTAFGILAIIQLFYADLKLSPCSIRKNISLYIFSTLLLGLSYFAHIKLNYLSSLVVGSIILIIAIITAIKFVPILKQ
jgi:O-antigen/teichoic acid export membrane protein